MDVTTPDLRTFYLYLTSGCNCACRHCWFVPEPGAASQNEILDPDVLRGAIEQGLPLGLLALKWTGGEPTFHPRFRELLDIQKEYGLDACIETNGMLIDDRLADQMIESGVSRASVSLDGAHAATHDAIRCVEGGFEKSCAGVKALVRAGYRPEIILTMQRSNVAEIPALLELAAELGAAAVKLNVLHPVLRGETLVSTGESLSVDEILALLPAHKSDWSKREDLVVMLDVPMAFRGLSHILSGVEDGACDIMHVLGILPTGEYALCGVGQHVSELAMGAVRDVQLEEVWRSHPVLMRVRDGLPQKLQGICGECLMQAACLGSCVAANYQLSGDLLAPYWFCQQAREQGLFPAMRRSVE